MIMNKHNSGFSKTKVFSNKRGFLLAEETLKIIIAVIAIILLIGFLTTLYMSFKSGQEEKQAQATVEKLKQAIDSQQESFTIYNPAGWFIDSWNVKMDAVPNICRLNGWENCICMTDLSFYQRSTTENLLKESKICLEVSQKVNFLSDDAPGSIQIRPVPVGLSIEKLNDEIKITKK